MTIILGDWLISSAHEPPQRNWGVRVDGDLVVDVAPAGVLRARYPYDSVHEATGGVIAPGFVNSHVHLYGVLAHGIPLQKAPSDFWAFLADFW